MSSRPSDLRGGEEAQARTIRVCGVRVADCTRAEIVEVMASLALSGSEMPRLAYAMHIGGLLSTGDAEYRAAMESATLVYADGVSVEVLGRIAGAKRIERAGTTQVGWDVLGRVLTESGRPARVAALGGPPGLARRALREMERRGDAVGVFATHGYHSEWSGVIERLSAAQPDIVFVGMGAPIEMKWVHEHAKWLPSALIITCGGWFGFVVGEERRAPAIVQKSGLEWLWRLLQQPRRLGPRYVKGVMCYPLFVLAVVRQRTMRGPES